MKTACTAFIMILLSTGCAKKFNTEESPETDNRYFVKVEEHPILKASTNIKSSLTFTQEYDFLIPDFIKVTSGDPSNHVAKIYFDYSDENNHYAYFCRYFPSEGMDNLIFDSCFKNEFAELQFDSVPSIPTQMVFYPGYIDLVNSGNSIILEISNNQDQGSIEVEVQLEIN